MFESSLYDSNLRLLMGIGQDVLFWSGGVVFGLLAARMSPSDTKLQLVVCAVVCFVWLMPYGRIEGILLPIFPLVGTGVALFGVYVGMVMTGRRRRDPS